MNPSLNPGFILSGVSGISRRSNVTIRPSFSPTDSNVYSRIPTKLPDIKTFPEEAPNGFPEEKVASLDEHIPLSMFGDKRRNFRTGQLSSTGLFEGPNRDPSVLSDLSALNEHLAFDGGSEPENDGEFRIPRTPFSLHSLWHSSVEAPNTKPIGIPNDDMASGGGIGTKGDFELTTPFSLHNLFHAPAEAGNTKHAAIPGLVTPVYDMSSDGGIAPGTDGTLFGRLHIRGSNRLNTNLLDGDLKGGLHSRSNNLLSRHPTDKFDTRSQLRNRFPVRTNWKPPMRTVPKVSVQSFKPVLKTAAKLLTRGRALF